MRRGCWVVVDGERVAAVHKDGKLIAVDPKDQGKIDSAKKADTPAKAKPAKAEKEG